MNPSKADQFVAELADVMGHRLTDIQRQHYVDALLEAEERLAPIAFRRLVKSARRWPTIAEVSAAFEAAREERLGEAEGTVETQRSRSLSSQSKRRLQESVRRYLEFEPVARHADLYWGYVDALREYRAGRRSRESLEELRRTLIEQATRRGIPEEGRTGTYPKPEDVSLPPSGIEASLPRGDR